MYRPVLDAVAHSLTLTALIAAIPLLVLFVLLGIVRLTAWLVALISLALAILVAILAYGMPAGQALLAGAEGAAFGFFPILWIVINAIWLYNLTVVTGHFDVLRRSFARVTEDQRIQAVLIAFCFGALMEALAGFGTPVAISSVMLIALGFRPLKAAVVSLVANTAPVAFGALAVPITTLAAVSGLPEHTLGAMVGRQTPLLGAIVPLALVYIVDRRAGIRQTLPAVLTCGLVFAGTQFAVSNFVSTQLTDIVAALAGAAAVVLVLRFWQPSESYTEATEPATAAVGPGVAAGTATGTAAAGIDATRTGAADDTDRADSTGDSGEVRSAPGERPPDTPAEVARAYAPYLIIIAIFVITQLPGIKSLFAAPTVVFQWPGLHLLSASGTPSTVPKFTFNWLSAAGTLMLIAGLLTIPVVRISPARALRAYGDTLRQLAPAIVTVMAVLGLAYVMNTSGETATLGKWFAGAGGLFALLSPILGWLGVAVTGSDTSSNSLFGALQAAAAKQVGISQILAAASNSSGGVLGKMISPQNLAIAAAAVGLTGREGDVFRRVIGWSVLFLAVMCILAYLQSTPILGWMVPR